MKNLVRIVALILIMSMSTALIAQKAEKVIVYKKNGDILKGTIEYLTENNKIRLNSDCGNSYLLDRSEIQEIKKDVLISEEKNKFYGNAELGLLIGFNRNADFVGIPFNFSLSSGVHVSDYFSMGVSSGVRMLDNTYIPVTVDFIYDFKVRNSGKSHFLRLKTGVPIILTNNSSDYFSYSSYYPYPESEVDENTIKNRRGFIFNPELGVKFNGQQNESFYLSISYLFQMDKFNNKNYYNQLVTEEHYYNRIMLNFGYFF